MNKLFQKKKWIRAAFFYKVILFFSFFIPLLIFATTFRAEPSTELVVDRHGECRKVVNSGTTAMFIPTKTTAEWLSFRLHAPNITLSSCVPKPFGDNPGSLSGVSFYNGTPESGMIVFKSVGSYSVLVQQTATVQVLVVGGGGSGGVDMGGGGGGGGVRYNSSFSLTTGSKSVVIGAGATGNQSGGSNGSNSTFATLTATGGGRGGNLNGGGIAGGSGGGGGWRSGAGGAGTSGQGNNGGAGNTGTSYSGGGGGGGAGGGGNNGSTYGGTGGAGVTYFGHNYAAGGGGGYSGTAGGASAGAGGPSGGSGGTARAFSGGGGGGGGPHWGVAGRIGGSGGSGIVIVRWGGYNKNYNPTTNAVSSNSLLQPVAQEGVFPKYLGKEIFHKINPSSSGVNSYNILKNRKTKS